MNERLNELSLELAQNEIDFRKLDGISALVMERYEIDNAVSLSLVIYSNLIGFGLTKTEEKAVEIVTELIGGYNTFQLKELAVLLLGEEVVSHYKDLIETDYKILAGPLAGMLRAMDKDLNNIMEELSESQESLSDMIPKISQ